MDTFLPAHAPSVGTDVTSNVRVIKNKFGDGYRQTALDGANAVTGSVPLSWDACSIADAAYMDNFLRTHAAKPFLYTLPRETRARVWDCESWKRGAPAGGYDRFSATFEERFDLY